MGLKDLVPVPKTLKFGEHELTLHALTMKDVIILLQQFAPEMGEMMEGKVDLPKLIANSPAFIATLIAQSAREVENFELVYQLPFTVQLAAIEAIWDISAVDGDMLGKLVLRAAEGMQKLNEQLKQQNANKKPPAVAKIGN